MRYVLDASVALKWALPEADSTKALALRAQAEQRVHQLIAPDVFPVEVAHALTRAERKGILVPPQASILLADMLAASPMLRPSMPLLARAVRLSSQYRIGVYDGLYIALAEEEDCELVTADERLVRTMQGVPRHPAIVVLRGRSNSRRLGKRRARGPVIRTSRNARHLARPLKLGPHSVSTSTFCTLNA
jgi:predicted nucleic acid-binding protein